MRVVRVSKTPAGDTRQRAGFTPGRIRARQRGALSGRAAWQPSLRAGALGGESERRDRSRVQLVPLGSMASRGCLPGRGVRVAPRGTSPSRPDRRGRAAGRGRARRVLPSIAPRLRLLQPHLRDGDGPAPLYFEPQLHFLFPEVVAAVPKHDSSSGSPRTACIARPQVRTALGRSTATSLCTMVRIGPPAHPCGQAEAS